MHGRACTDGDARIKSMLSSSGVSWTTIAFHVAASEQERMAPGPPGLLEVNLNMMSDHF